jgi:hypothetical protein
MATSRSAEIFQCHRAAPVLSRVQGFEGPWESLSFCDLVLPAFVLEKALVLPRCHWHAATGRQRQGVLEGLAELLSSQLLEPVIGPATSALARLH